MSNAAERKCLPMLEHPFQCPYCWEEISVLLDRSVPRQVYVEDCEICCNPIEISVSFREGELQEFDVQNLGQ